MLSVEQCKPEDFDHWIELAHQAYYDYYTVVWNDQGEWYANKSFNQPLLQKVNQEEGGFIGWCCINNEAVGIILLRINQKFPSATDRQGLLLDKIYLRKKAMGRGLGTFCMKWVEEYASQYQQNMVWLTAMDFSDAYGFYQKLGYQKEDTIILDYPNMRPTHNVLHFMQRTLKV